MDGEAEIGVDCGRRSTGLGDRVVQRVPCTSSLRTSVARHRAPLFLLAGALGDDSFASGPYLLPAVAAGLYLLGSVPLLLGRSWTWRFLAFFFALLLFGNVVFFVFTWNQGVEFQGAAYTWIVLSLHVLCAVLAGAALFVAWRRATHASLVSVHIALFCWLSWVAFPWLGEMP